MARHASGSVEHADNARWTTGRLLDWMTGHFKSRGLESPRLCAEMLLGHVLDCERMRLYMEVDRPASPDERDRLRELVVRAGQHEPVQYLVGEGWFFSLPFQVDRSTLIPRPSTESLVECALHWHREITGAHETPPPSSAPVEADDETGEDPVHDFFIADIGTGTGCIAISLARQIAGCRVVATDLAEDAIRLATANARRHGVAEKIDFRVGSLFEPITGPDLNVGPFDLICSNPPYIPDHEWDAVARNVKDYEPQAALRGGPDGLDVIRPLVAQAADHLKPGGLLLVEIAHSHREAALELARQTAGLSEPEVLKDHEGYWRVLRAVRA